MKRTLTAMLIAASALTQARSQQWIARNPSPHGETFVSMIAKGDSLLASTSWSGVCSFSSDRGATWETRWSDRIPWGGMLGFATDTSIVISQRSGAIARTSDWGGHWSVIRERYDVSGTIAVHFFDAKEGLIVAPNPNDSFFVARTTDGGASWDEQRMQFGRVRVQSVSFLPDGNLFTGGYHQVPYQSLFFPHLIFSVDRLRSWKEIQTLPAGISYIKAISFHDTSTGMILTEKGWYRTADGCRSWATVSTEATSFDKGKILLDPRSSIGYIVHGSTSTALSRTTDAGVNWTPVLFNVPDGSSVDGVFLLDSLTAFAYGEGGAIYRSTDAGTTWNRVHGFGPTTGFSSIRFADGLRGAALSAGNAYAVTTDGGMSWQGRSLANNLQFVAVHFRTGERGYAVAHASSGGYYLLSTADGGLTWDQRPQIPVKNYWGVGSGRPNGIAAVGEGQVWISAGGGTIYKTTDDGASWNAFYIFPVFGTYSSFAAADLGHFWYAQDNIVSLTTDTLRTFSIHDPATIAESIPDIHDIFFADTLRGWICGDWPQFSHPNASFLMRTTDGGRNWTQVAGVYGSDFVWKDRDNAVSFSGGWFGYNAGEPIRVTENAWNTWSDYPFWSVDIIGYGIRDAHSLWAVGWGGRIYEMKR